MKKILILSIALNFCLTANDPTIPKGKLKELINSELNSSANKSIKVTPNSQILDSDKIQEDVNKITFKAFFLNDSVERLLIEFDKVNFLLETGKEVELNGNKFRVLKITNKNFILEHSITSLQFNINYRK